MSVRLLALHDVDGRYLGRQHAVVLDTPGLYALSRRDCPCRRCTEGMSDPVTCPHGRWRWRIACAAGLTVLTDLASLPIARAAARDLAAVGVPWTVTHLPALLTAAAADDVARQVQTVRLRARAAEHGVAATERANR